MPESVKRTFSAPLGGFSGSSPGVTTGSSVARGSGRVWNCRSIWPGVTEPGSCWACAAPPRPRPATTHKATAAHAATARPRTDVTSSDPARLFSQLFGTHTPRHALAHDNATLPSRPPNMLPSLVFPPSACLSGRSRQSPNCRRTAPDSRRKRQGRRHLQANLAVPIRDNSVGQFRKARPVDDLEAGRSFIVRRWYNGRAKGHTGRPCNPAKLAAFPAEKTISARDSVRLHFLDEVRPTAG